MQGQSLDTGKQKYGITGLTYSERIALDPTDDSALDFFDFFYFFLLPQHLYDCALFNVFSRKDCQFWSLNATLAARKVVLCFAKSDQQNMISAAAAIIEAGGIGLIYAQYGNNQLDSCHVIPCIRVDYEVGTQILSYIRKAR